LYLHLLSKKARRNNLIERFGSEKFADNIIQGIIWQGMTGEMLTECLGKPIDMDRSVYKTKTKETWKYGRVGKNRFEKKIILENGTVVGWTK
jgi:hypothetical protein